MKTTKRAGDKIPRRLYKIEKSEVRKIDYSEIQSSPNWPQIIQSIPNPPNTPKEHIDIIDK